MCFDCNRRGVLELPCGLTDMYAHHVLRGPGFEVEEGLMALL